MTKVERISNLRKGLVIKIKKESLNHAINEIFINFHRFSHKILLTGPNIIKKFLVCQCSFKEDLIK